MRGKFLFILSALLYCCLVSTRLFAPVNDNNDIVPIENWERNEKIDNKVIKIIGDLEDICSEYKDNPEAIGWSPEAAKLVFELKDLGRSAIPALYDVAKDKQRNGNLRRIAISRMAFTLEPAVTKPLTEFLRDKYEDLKIRINAADLLGRILKDTTATPAMIEVMMDTSNSEILRSKVATGFVSIHDERAIQSLIELAEKDRSRDVRAMAAWGIGSNAHFFKDTTFTMPLLRMLEKEKNDIVRMKIIGAMGVTNDKRIIEPLKKLLDTKGPNYDDAIKALGNPRFPEAKELLINIMKSDDEAFRTNAAEALIKIADRAVISEIEAILPKLSEKDARKIQKKLNELERGGGL